MGSVTSLMETHFLRIGGFYSPADHLPSGMGVYGKSAMDRLKIPNLSLDERATERVNHLHFGASKKAADFHK
jgi:hypothetical protein